VIPSETAASLPVRERIDLRDERRVLATLAAAGPCGHSESIIAEYFGMRLVTGLVREGWASVQVESVRAGGRTVDVVRMRITGAGRKALAER
jgi:hypothetical protein